jgi:iron complex transport system permease protein
VWAAIVRFDPNSTEHLIIRTLRVPRAAVAALVGAALAVAGALMQGLTRNPLADPGILGIETGAALGVVGAVFFLQISSLTVYALFAFAGAALTAAAVYGLGSLGRGGPTPLKITIAGAAFTALLSSLTTAMLILNQRTMEEVRFWLAGSLAGRDLTLLAQAAPYLLLGMALALALGRQITTIALGDDVARGLGQRTGWVKALAAVATVLLAGGAVAVAGPIGFVGLVIPHVVRFLVGMDYRWILPYAALVGAIFLVASDLAARLVLRPLELPVGVMTALIGGPFFIYLVRWRVKR